MTTKIDIAQLEPTPGIAWRRPRDEGFLYRFSSSGNLVKIRPVGFDTIIAYIKKGLPAPDMLTGVALNALEGRTEDTPRLTLENVETYIETVNVIAAQVLVYPRVVEANPTDDEIVITDLSFDERIELYAMLGAPARTLERFCQQSLFAVADVGVAEGDGETGKPDNENPPDGSKTDGDA